MLLTSKLCLCIAFVIGRAAATPETTHDIPPTTEGLAPSDSQIGANALIVTPLGVVTAINYPFSTGLTYMYYQNPMGDIIQHVIQGGAFNTGSTSGLSVMVMANYTRRGTPITASMRSVKVPSRVDLVPELHLYYFTPNYTIGEVRYNFDTGWISGARGACPWCRDIPCPLCIDSAGFKAAEGSQVLYTIHDKDDQNILRVGFESTGIPGTMSEAVTTNSGRIWQIAPVPN